jgi:hypothetical protein
MKKILYAITSLAHKRAIQSFLPRKDVEQLIVGPKANIVDGMVKEDYSIMGIQNIKNYNDASDFQKIVNDFCPDFYIQPDMSPMQHKIKLPSLCRRIYVSHGMVGRHVKNMVHKNKWDVSVWKGCNLYCGATKIFEDWVEYAAKVNKSSIILNAIPQFDVLYNLKNKNNDTLKDNIFRSMKNDRFKSILFFGGFCCKDRVDFLEHNEDYFKTCAELEKLAEKNNWLILVKPRQVYGQINEFLIKHQKNWNGWTKKYIDFYNRIQKSKYLKFINTSCGIENYYLISDAIIINGCSTMEVESYILKKPLIIVNSNTQSISYNSFSNDEDSTAYRVSDFSKLEGHIQMALYPRQDDMEIKRQALLKSYELEIDGKMHERIINKILDVNK